MNDDYKALMLNLWQSACRDTPSRPSARVEDGHFVLTINGNRSNWTAIMQAAGVPGTATQTVAGDTLTARWPSVADAIFGPGGQIAAIMPGYEVRAAQLHMARLVQRAIEMNEPAVIEGATGTGKSFAYAAVCMALGKKVIISTSNKALQMQLADKDLPFLQRIFPGKQVAVSVGKSNYACRAKADYLGERGANIMDAALADWYAATTTGNTEEIPFAPDYKALKAMTVDDDCDGRHCPLYDECFYYTARARMQTADVIVTNHALLCLNEVAGGHILPPADVVVVDEAHKLPDYMRSTSGHKIAVAQIAKAIDLTDGYAEQDFGPATALRCFEHAIAGYLYGKEDPQIGMQNDTLDNATDLAQVLRRMAGEVWPEDMEPESGEEIKRQRRARKVRNLADGIEQMGIQPPDMVRWIDQETPPIMNAQPVDVASLISKMATSQTTIFTSATLAAPDMGHFMRQAGLTRALQMQAASPFDYAANALLYLPAAAAPAPSAPEWTDWMIGEMRQLVLGSMGGAFLLFTSYTAMRLAVTALADTFIRRGLTVLVQGDMPKLEIARRFRDDGSAVLFATKSFFEGVSIDGQALRLVVVDKMPFEAPSPLLQAMEADLMDKARAAGMSGKTLEMHPFNALRVPRMVLELKQACGRLIRTQDDQGVLAVLDSRIRATMYGRNVVLPSLPPAALTSRPEHVAAFFGTLPPLPAKLTAPPAETRAEKRKATPPLPAMAVAALGEELPF